MHGPNLFLAFALKGFVVTLITSLASIRGRRRTGLEHPRGDQIS